MICGISKSLTHPLFSLFHWWLVKGGMVQPQAKKKKNLISWVAINLCQQTFYKGSDSKYFGLCRPYWLYYNHSTLLSQHKSSHRQHRNKCPGCVPIKLYSLKLGANPDLTYGPPLVYPWWYKQPTERKINSYCVKPLRPWICLLEKLALPWLTKCHFHCLRSLL